MISNARFRHAILIHYSTSWLYRCNCESLIFTVRCNQGQSGYNLHFSCLQSNPIINIRNKAFFIHTYTQYKYIYYSISFHRKHETQVYSWCIIGITCECLRYDKMFLFHSYTQFSFPPPVSVDMEAAIKTVVLTFINSAKNKDGLGQNDFKKLVQKQLGNILAVRISTKLCSPPVSL